LALGDVAVQDLQQLLLGLVQAKPKGQKQATAAKPAKKALHISKLLKMLPAKVSLSLQPAHCQHCSGDDSAFVCSGWRLFCSAARRLD
jgi:hypothetical protein